MKKYAFTIVMVLLFAAAVAFSGCDEQSSQVSTEDSIDREIEAAETEEALAEQERLAAEQAEQERLAEEEAEQERLAAEQAAQTEQELLEQERLAAEQAEQERLSAEKAEQERLAAEQAEQDRIAAEQAAAEAAAAEKKQITVIITNTGSKYHIDGCRTLKSKIPISLGDAVARGYEPCKVCNPPRL